MSKSLALAVALAALTTSFPAHAGITAVFGAVKPVALTAPAAHCPAPGGELDRLVPITLVDPR